MCQRRGQLAARDNERSTATGARCLGLVGVQAPADRVVSRATLRAVAAPTVGTLILRRTSRVHRSRLAHEPEHLFRAAPGERHTRATMSVVVHDDRAPYPFALEPDGGSNWPKASLHPQHFGAAQTWLELEAAAHDGAADFLAHRCVEAVLFGRPAEHDVLAPGNDVGDAARVILVEQRQ